jgi:hypothetical protein
MLTVWPDQLTTWHWSPTLRKSAIRIRNFFAFLHPDEEFLSYREFSTFDAHE